MKNIIDKKEEQFPPKRKLFLDDPSKLDLLVQKSSTIYGFKWKNGEFTRCPDPDHYEISYLKPNKKVKKPKALPKLYERYKERPINGGQMNCTLEFKNYGISYYRELRLAFIRLEFISNCIKYSFTKYFYVDKLPVGNVPLSVTFTVKGNEFELIFDDRVTADSPAESYNFYKFDNKYVPKLFVMRKQKHKPRKENEIKKKARKLLKRQAAKKSRKKVQNKRRKAHKIVQKRVEAIKKSKKIKKHIKKRKLKTTVNKKSIELDEDDSLFDLPSDFKTSMDDVIPGDTSTPSETELNSRVLTENGEDANKLEGTQENPEFKDGVVSLKEGIENPNKVESVRDSFESQERELSMNEESAYKTEAGGVQEIQAVQDKEPSVKRDSEDVDKSKLFQENSKPKDRELSVILNNPDTDLSEKSTDELPKAKQFKKQPVKRKLPLSAIPKSSAAKISNKIEQLQRLLDDTKAEAYSNWRRAGVHVDIIPGFENGVGYHGYDLIVSLWGSKNISKCQLKLEETRMLKKWVVKNDNKNGSGPRWLQRNIARNKYSMRCEVV